MIGEAVGDHAFGNRIGPTDQDTSGRFVVVACQAKTANRNKRIAAPICKPWISGDDRLSILPFNDVLLGRTFDTSNVLPPLEFGFMHDFEYAFGWRAG